MSQTYAEEERKILKGVLNSENLKVYDASAKHKTWTEPQMWFFLVSELLIKYSIHVQSDVNITEVIAAWFF